MRHREEQEAYCRRFVALVIAEVELRQLNRLHFARVLGAAPTPSVASHLRRCLTAMVAAGLEEGLLLATQDVLRGVHWRDPATEGDGLDAEEEGRFVDEADNPTASAVHALAAAAERVWWRELQVLAVAYSGPRWGEMAALTADRVDVARRRILVDRQVVEGHHGLALAPPKNRRRRTTMYPARTPGGAELGALLARRLGELASDGLVFPSPRGAWARRSKYRRNTFDPAADAAGWPRRPDGRRAWTFHSLRHVFATWALSQPGPASRTCRACSGTPPYGSPRTCTSPPTATSSSGSTGRRSDGLWVPRIDPGVPDTTRGSNRRRVLSRG